MKTQPIFTHASIQLLLKEHATYLFSLEEIAIPVVVKIYQLVNGDGFVSRQSHFIKTPLQMAAHQANSPSDESDVRCLNRALSDLTLHYFDAVSSGSKPKKEWLIKNPDFV